MKQNGKRSVRLVKKKELGRIPPNNLTALRERGKGRGGIWLTIEEVSRLTGLSSGYISLQENGKRPMSDEQVTMYARIYKVQTHQIFSGLTVRKASA
jgi:transcriptional regulator with XRE-family HTH domain